MGSLHKVRLGQSSAAEVYWWHHNTLVPIGAIHVEARYASYGHLNRGIEVGHQEV